MEGFLKELERAKRREDVGDAIQKFRDDRGLQHALYHWINANGDPYGAGTYASEWQDHYYERGYLRIDPVVEAAYKRFHPIDWRRLDWSSRSIKNLKGESIDAGVGRHGLTIPIRGPSGQFAHFTVTQDCSDDQWDAYIAENVRNLILAGHYINQKMLEVSGDRDESERVQLSPRETDALTCLALGYSRAQAAETLSISEHTLRVYIESARAKLQAMNTTHAIAKALQLGLLVL